MSRTLSFLRYVSVLSVFSLSGIAQTPELPDIPSAALAAYKQGLEAEGRQQLDLALERYQFALKQAHQCFDCMAGVARAQQATGDNKGALATAAKMWSVASTLQGKARADTIAGRVYYAEFFGYSQGEGFYDKNPGKARAAMQHAEASFGRAAQEDPTDERALMLHGYSLAGLNSDPEASKAFTACAAVPGTSATECARALRFAKNVDLARHEPAEAFTATTLDGGKVSLDSLSGKIVLLDFWGSWCPVCRSDMSYVKSLQDTFGKDSFGKDRFVLVEVDSGDTPEVWKKFVKENFMQGVQVQDMHHELLSSFRVSAFPTYVILDGNGTIRTREVGAKGDLRGDIGKLLAEMKTQEGVSPAKP